MNSIYNKLMKCYDCFQKKINFTPEIALVLGSGLGNYASKIKIEATLDYHDIDGFPVSTVPGHQGRYIFRLCGECSRGLYAGACSLL